MKRPIESRRRFHREAIAVILVMSAAAFAGGCLKPLPEANSAAAQLYVRRCGQCHRAYPPTSLAPEMWALQVSMMEAKMRQYRVPPLTEPERDTILSYLTRNASR
jgi:mono/diheme cytochrome c family protein